MQNLCNTMALLTSMTLTACAPTIWDKAGGTQTGFNQDSAQCRLVARGMNPGTFYAQGSPAFVASAEVGNAIGTAANQAATYRDCMMALGYTPRNANEANVSEGASASPGDCGGGPGLATVCR
jgi:hypothetical protein